MMGDQSMGGMDPTMPPPNYDKAFIMYTLNSDMIPNFYNGIKKEGVSHSINV